MLKIEIFDNPEPEKTPTLMLNTRLTEHGHYEVFACDSGGKVLPYGILWLLYPSGRQRCLGTISDKLGLDLDDSGHIRDV